MAKEGGKLITLKQKCENIRGWLINNKAKLSLPKDIDKTDFINTAVFAINQNPRLGECDDITLVKCILQASRLALEVGGPKQECHLVPFKKTCQLIPGYQGLRELAYRSGQVKLIWAEAVHEADDFAIELGLERKLTHKPVTGKERGALVGVYAVAQLQNDTRHFVYMSRKEIEAIRGKSAAYKAGGDTPWKDSVFEDWMWKKTAIKQLCKDLPKSTDDKRLAQAVRLDDQADANVPQSYDMDINFDVVEGNGDEGKSTLDQFAEEHGETTEQPETGAEPQKPTQGPTQETEQAPDITTQKSSKQWMADQVAIAVEKKGVTAEEYDEIAYNLGVQGMSPEKMTDKTLAKLLESLYKVERKE